MFKFDFPKYPPPKLKNLEFFPMFKFDFSKLPPPEIEKLIIFPMFKFDFSKLPPSILSFSILGGYFGKIKFEPRKKF